MKSDNLQLITELYRDNLYGDNRKLNKYFSATKNDAIKNIANKNIAIKR